MKVAMCVFLSMLMSAPLATAGDDGRNKIASSHGWTAYALDGFSYMDGGAYQVADTACMVETGSRQAGLRVVFFPGASVRILQLGSRDWDLKSQSANLRVEAGPTAVSFKGARYGGEFVQHVASAAKGGVSSVQELASGGPDMTFMGNNGKVLMRVRTDGFAAMLAKAVDCAKRL